MTTSTSPPLPELPKRAADSHKGDFGRALLVGGSVGMSGAISLAGMAALRSGAGLVTVATPDACLPIVAAFDPCYMTAPLASDQDGRIAAQAREKIFQLTGPATAIACGPGLGRSQRLVGLVARMYVKLAKPAVFDADALFALSESPQDLLRAGGPRILTPHPGEFARLVGEPQVDRAAAVNLAIERAGQWKAIVVLKGHETLVTDGEQSYVNRTGNPGMATGGTGDVLTGVITALLCQGLAPFAAAQLGVYVHGAAGDLAAAKLGQVSMTARDLLEHLPHAFGGF